MVMHYVSSRTTRVNTEASDDKLFGDRARERERERLCV
jgi:hypothetical protein